MKQDWIKWGGKDKLKKKVKIQKEDRGLEKQLQKKKDPKKKKRRL